MVRAGIAHPLTIFPSRALPQLPYPYVAKYYYRLRKIASYFTSDERINRVVSLRNLRRSVSHDYSGYTAGTNSPASSNF